MPDNFWSGADIIDIYTRRQTIEDGVLVQLSGPGYQGDPWIPAMVAGGWGMIRPLRADWPTATTTDFDVRKLSKVHHFRLFRKCMPLAILEMSLFSERTCNRTIVCALLQQSL